MVNALAVTEAGMLNDVARMHVISHNLANAGTVGFKKEFTVARSFENHVASAAADYTAPVIAARTDYSEGTLKYTGNPLDAALEGPGFFVVSTPTGEAYTRQGNFRLDANGRLVTSNGFAVLGTGGEIQLTTTTPRIDAHGSVWDGNSRVGQLTLVNIKDPQSLTPMGEGLYMARTTSDFDQSGPQVRQGFTEAANVVTMSEMIKMIETVRHFEASERFVRGYDTMLDRAINIV
ncbi:MAG TPA: flagellar hook-basal body protein, partial [Burkholderiales bacterium]